MKQIAQLSEAEIEERFHITGQRPVAFMLEGLAKASDQLSVFFNNDDTFLTTLLAVLPQKNQLIFDCSGSAETNRRLLDAQRTVFVGAPGGVRVQFTCGPVTELSYEGSKAFAVSMPKFIIRLQRREYFRVETPRAHPLQFFARIPGGALLNAPIHDISVAGIGLTASTLPDGLAVGQVLENCHFVLPGDDHDLLCRAIVANLNEREGRAGARQWQIGLYFKNLPGADENRIQRYIARLERERRELL